MSVSMSRSWLELKGGEGGVEGTSRAGDMEDTGGGGVKVAVKFGKEAGASVGVNFGGTRVSKVWRASSDSTGRVETMEVAEAGAARAGLLGEMVTNFMTEGVFS